MYAVDSVEFYHSLPKKRMASGFLILNDQNHILIVKPAYRDYWLIPGGIVEENESPLQTAVRETLEETGIVVTPGRLLCLDYRLPEGNKTESLQFIFGVASWSGTLQPDKTELEEAGFYPAEEAFKRLNPSLANRTRFAFQANENNTCFYLENGQNPFGKAF